MKIKELTARLKNSLKKLLYRFPSSLVMSLLATCVVSYVIIVDNSSETSERLILSFITAAFFALALALVFEKKAVKNKTLITGIASAAVALLTYGIWCSSLNDTYKYMGNLGIIFALVALAMGLLYQQATERQLFPKLVSNLVFTGIVTLIAFGGLVICLLAFDTLIIELDDLGKIVSLLFFWICCFAAFNIFIALLPEKDEEITVSRAYDIIANKVGFYVYLLLVAILYAYIIKIAVTFKMPVGVMNWYGSLALLFYVYFYLSLQPQDGKMQKWFIDYGALLLLPVLAVQLYAIYVRISAYGLTVLRCLSLVCIFMGVLVMINSLSFKKTKWVMYSWVAVILLATVTPLNVVDVPYRSQWHRAQKIIEKYDLLVDGEYVYDAAVSDDDIETLVSCWHYLKYENQGQQSAQIKKFIDADISTLSRETEKDFKSYSYYRPDMVIDVSGYNTIQEVYSRDSSQYSYLGGYDVQPLIDELISKTDAIGGEEYDGKLMYCPDDSHEIIITRMYFYFSEGNVTYFEAEGYLLSR